MTSETTEQQPDAEQQMVQPFWTAVDEGRLVVQRCADCSYLRWPPGPVCPECQSRDAQWAEVGQTGRLISYAVYHRALDPTFYLEVPYVVGYVELDSGPRLYGNVLGDRHALKVDARVRASFASGWTERRMVAWEMAS